MIINKAKSIWAAGKQVLEEELGGYKSVEGPTPGIQKFPEVSRGTRYPGAQQQKIEGNSNY